MTTEEVQAHPDYGIIRETAVEIADLAVGERHNQGMYARVLEFATEQIAAALSAASAARPAAERLDKLPCDVHLPPNTILRKGCEISTLMAALTCRAVANLKSTAGEQ